MKIVFSIASLVVGVIGLGVFFKPVLKIICGIGGLVVSILGKDENTGMVIDGIRSWGRNVGDTSHLMPTITEWWTPTDADATLADIRNHDNYLRSVSFNELRITFMKNITSEGYTFIGIYKLAPSSTPQRLVWQRIAERLDLRHLDQLDLLRQ